MDTRKGKGKQINNEHKKGEGKNRLTMDTRKGKDKQTNNGHEKRERQTD